MCRCWRWWDGREAELGQVALRRLGSQAQDVVSLDDAAASLAAEALPPDIRRSAMPAMATV